MAWNVWVQEDSLDLKKVSADAKHFMIIATKDDLNRISAFTDSETDDLTLKRMYYTIEEHLRKRNVLPPMPQPVPIEKPEGKNMILATGDLT